MFEACGWLKSHVQKLVEKGKLLAYGPTNCWVTRTQLPAQVDGQPLARLILEAKLGRLLRPDYLACHLCDDHRCINPAHLYEGTATDNAQDLRARGKSPVSRNPRGQYMLDERLAFFARRT